MTGPGAGPVTGAAPRPGGRRWRRIGLVVAGLVVAAAPWWGRRALQALAFFHVRRVEVHGVRWLDPQVVVDRMRIDTTRSVWDDLGVWERRVAGHPQVKAVEVDRRLPGTIVVTITEVVPVALIPGKDGFRAFDASGRALPVAPNQIPVDAPIVAQRDSAVLALLGRVRDDEPDVFARISEVRRSGGRELVVTMGDLPVRTLTEVTPARLAEILPVARDLDRRGLRAKELDLRYRAQVVARLP